jgi:hypothetical protein
MLRPCRDHARSNRLHMHLHSGSPAVRLSMSCGGQKSGARLTPSAPQVRSRLVKFPSTLTAPWALRFVILGSDAQRPRPAAPCGSAGGGGAKMSATVRHRGGCKFSRLQRLVGAIVTACQVSHEGDAARPRVPSESLLAGRSFGVATRDRSPAQSTASQARLPLGTRARQR